MAEVKRLVSYLNTLAVDGESPGPQDLGVKRFPAFPVNSFNSRYYGMPGLVNRKLMHRRRGAF